MYPFEEMMENKGSAIGEGLLHSETLGKSQEGHCFACNVPEQSGFGKVNVPGDDRCCNAQNLHAQSAFGKEILGESTVIARLNLPQVLGRRF